MSKGNHHPLRHRGLIDLALGHQFKIKLIVALCTLTIAFTKYEILWAFAKFWGLKAEHCGWFTLPAHIAHSAGLLLSNIGSVASSSKTKFLS